LVVALGRSRGWGRHVDRLLIQATTIGLVATGIFRWWSDSLFLEILALAVFGAALLQLGLAVTGRRAIRLNEQLVSVARPD
jgi:hypothetical protein